MVTTDLFRQKMNAFIEEDNSSIKIQLRRCWDSKWSQVMTCDKRA
jgi:hypothetical protein